MAIRIQEIIGYLEELAPPVYQENYDNAGLIIGDPETLCTGVLICLDLTLDIIREAEEKKTNLIVAHHPILFRTINKIGKSMEDKMLIECIKKDIHFYAIHTNLDKVANGVSFEMARKIGLLNVRILAPEKKTLKKLYTYVPIEYVEKVQTALFDNGAGHIGAYKECSFSVQGEGTFYAPESTNPFAGKTGIRHTEKEMKIETIFPLEKESQIIRALLQTHPYEEPAYDILSLENINPKIGAGAIGILEKPIPFSSFLHFLKTIFGTPLIRHSKIYHPKVQNIALCGGSGAFLIPNALQNKADIFITADLKYHDFFLSDEQLILCDIGHYESEQFTISLIYNYLIEKNLNFAVHTTRKNTNPISYF